MSKASTVTILQLMVRTTALKLKELQAQHATETGELYFDSSINKLSEIEHELLKFTDRLEENPTPMPPAPMSPITPGTIRKMKENSDE